MIATDRQLHRARAELDHLRAAGRSAEAASSLQDVSPELARAERAGIQARIDELAAEIQQFEDLREGIGWTIPVC